ncbi:hypothetical protein [Marinicellulosiphila megalodicopiae]|uniref:hypothetical protein n=1 Tax=Marinicellulosiphila megalodicopiae TaxID=2724896 RepID=UPI003BAFFBE7
MRINETEYENALKVFLNNSIIAQQLLGEDDTPKSWKKSPLDNVDNNERLSILLNELKGWVVLKSEELEEFEGDDLIRLTGEAVGCMYAIRELEFCFPELKSI